MDPREIFLSFSSTLTPGKISLSAPRANQLSPLEDPHQVVDEVFRVAIAIDLVRLCVLQPVAAPNKRALVCHVFQVGWRQEDHQPGTDHIGGGSKTIHPGKGVIA